MNFKENLAFYLEENFVDELIDSLNDTRVNSLILNTNKIDKDTFVKLFPKIIPHSFLENVFYYNKEDYEFGKSFLFTNGAYYIMDTSSMLVSYNLKINDNDKVLDLCAAPGGKTIALSLFNKDKNFYILSNDLSYKRSLELSKNIEHLGLKNVLISNSDFSKIYNHYLNTFDKIIVDAPCSGSAMFRKNELAKLDWTIDKVNKLKSEQINILNYALKMLKNGGKLIYSTCSFSYEEDEGVILEILKENKDVSVLPFTEHEGYFHHNSLKESIHLFPNLYKGEGQFMCLLTKNNDEVNITYKNKPNIKHKNLLNSLNYNNEVIIDDELYFYNAFIDTKYLNVIRYMLDAYQIKKDIFIPSFHLAHAINKSDIKLDKNEAKKYLHGEELTKKLNLKNDYYIVSYLNVNLGYVKYVNGKLKNLYPKGLRR